MEVKIFVRETKGHHGHARTGPGQILVRARSNPVIGPVRDLTGHSGHARSNPVRAPAGVVIWAGPKVGVKGRGQRSGSKVRSGSRCLDSHAVSSEC